MTDITLYKANNKSIKTTKFFVKSGTVIDDICNIIFISGFSFSSFLIF